MRARILFMCGTLELSKSGVADFIHVLAHELARFKIKPAFVSLNDPYVLSRVDDSLPNLDLEDFPVLRLSPTIPWTVRSKKVRDFVDHFNPDWISLHYVPYAYHPKGLPFSMLRCLNSIKNTANWEITAHELWLDPNINLRSRIISFIQRLILIRLFNSLQPSVVHVTNHCYKNLLFKYGIKSVILPLFSSIPFNPYSPRDCVSTSEWTFILFGSLNRDWKPEPLLSQIYKACLLHGIKICHFVSIGNIGNYGASVWDSLSSFVYPSFTFRRLGELPAELISEHLQHANFGISVMPSALVGKSSSVAAMLAHGLPVIISRLSAGCDAWHQTLRQSGKYILLDSSFVDSLVTVKKYQPENQLEDTTTRFIAALGSCL